MEGFEFVGTSSFTLIVSDVANFDSVIVGVTEIFVDVVVVVELSKKSSNNWLLLFDDSLSVFECVDLVLLFCRSDGEK